MTTKRDRLQAATERLNDNELDVLILVAERLELGASAYGRMDVANDPRDMVAELAEELTDALVYHAMAVLKGALRTRNVAAGKVQPLSVSVEGSGAVLAALDMVGKYDSDATRLRRLDDDGLDELEGGGPEAS